ncbi:MAG: indole-3-glycerol-phosphate synthase [Planctomycetota bacterium]
MITLDEILASTRRRVAALRARGQAAPRPRYAPRPFLARLQEHQGGLAVIAEIKRASPSCGPIRPDLDVAALAQSYERGGAAALSVLTEPEFFHGQPADLDRARAATRLPLLRKDFIIDELQLDEALHHGADAVLLVASALGERDLQRLTSAARDRGLEVLHEVHDVAEIDRVRALAPAAIGVNNRDLKTMQVDAERVMRLTAQLPRTALWVAESGFGDGREIARASQAGYAAFLIGQRLLTRPDPGTALATMLREARAWCA